MNDIKCNSQDDFGRQSSGIAEYGVSRFGSMAAHYGCASHYTEACIPNHSLAVADLGTGWHFSTPFPPLSTALERSGYVTGQFSNPVLDGSRGVLTTGRELTIYENSLMTVRRSGVAEFHTPVSEHAGMLTVPTHRTMQFSNPRLDTSHGVLTTGRDSTVYGNFLMTVRRSEVAEFHTPVSEHAGMLTGPARQTIQFSNPRLDASHGVWTTHADPSVFEIGTVDKRAIYPTPPENYGGFATLPPQVSTGAAWAQPDLALERSSFSGVLADSWKDWPASPVRVDSALGDYLAGRVSESAREAVASHVVQGDVFVQVIILIHAETGTISQIGRISSN